MTDWKLYRATIHTISRTHVEFEAPADADRDVLAELAYEAADDALERHESDDMERYPFKWDKTSRHRVPHIVEVPYPKE